MTGRRTALWQVVAVVVAVESPVHQAMQWVEPLARHVPRTPEDELCWCNAPWPCEALWEAARGVHEAGLHVADFVPERLHGRLWPQQIPSAHPAGAEQAGLWR